MSPALHAGRGTALPCRPGSRSSGVSSAAHPYVIERFPFVVRGDLVRSGLVWGFSCQAVVLGCAESFLFGAGKAVFRPVACNQVPGARGRGQGTETLAELGGSPPSVACVSQRLDA